MGDLAVSGRSLLVSCPRTAEGLERQLRWQANANSRPKAEVPA